MANTTSATGTAHLLPTGTTALTGTLAKGVGATDIVGTSTLFTTELAVGDVIILDLGGSDEQTQIVSSIADATNLVTVDDVIGTPSGVSATVRLSTDSELFTEVTTESTINRSLVNNIGTNISVNANDGNSVASGTLNRAYGQGTTLMVTTLFVNKTPFDIVIDPNNVRQSETEVPSEAVGTGDGSTKVFYTDMHPIRSTLVVRVDGAPKTEGSDYTIEYDNAGTVNQGAEITFVVSPVDTKAVTARYFPETSDLLMHVGCELTNVQVNPDASSDDHVAGTFPYVAQDWIKTLGPQSRNPTI